MAKEKTENVSGFQTVIATVNKLDGTKYSIDYNFGADLNEAIDLYGANIVYNGFCRNLAVDLQAVIRRVAVIKKGDDHIPVDPEKVQEIVSNWKPGIVQRSGKSKVERFAEKYDKMSPEERAEFDAFLASREG